MLREPLAQAMPGLRDSRTKLSDCITLEDGGPFKDGVALPVDESSESSLFVTQFTRNETGCGTQLHELLPRPVVVCTDAQDRSSGNKHRFARGGEVSNTAGYRQVGVAVDLSPPGCPGVECHKRGCVGPSAIGDLGHARFMRLKVAERAAWELGKYLPQSLVPDALLHVERYDDRLALAQEVFQLERLGILKAFGVDPEHCIRTLCHREGQLCVFFTIQRGDAWQID
jgi:hypothetical protein